MKKQILGPYIIGSALIWGVTIIGASLRLGGFENKSEVLALLGAGAGIHLILIWGPLAAAFKKLMNQQGDKHRE
jgi:hypothetical protein